MKKYVDVLIEKTQVNGKDVDNEYYNNLIDEIDIWLKSKPSKEDEEKFYKNAWVEIVFMCSDYSDK